MQKFKNFKIRSKRILGFIKSDKQKSHLHFLLDFPDDRFYTHRLQTFIIIVHFCFMVKISSKINYLN